MGVDAHGLMFFLGDDRVVRLELILFQERLSVSDLHIKKRVTQTENLVRHGVGERMECSDVDGELGGLKVAARAVGGDTNWLWVAD